MIIREVDPEAMGYFLAQREPYRVWQAKDGATFRFPPGQPEKFLVCEDMMPVGARNDA